MKVTEIIEVFDENFKMGDLVPELKCMDLLEARQKIVEMLEKSGDLVKIEDYTHNVGKCYRCHSTIEPHISDQWFVKMEDLAKPAIAAVRNGDIRFIPEKYEKTYFNWMENIRDWCISRQLWWGHRIPAYYCEECGEMVVAEEAPTVCPKCGGGLLKKTSKTGKVFYGCANYPKCDFVTWDTPAPKLCPTCGSFMKSVEKEDGTIYVCTNRLCKHVERPKED